MSTIALNNNTYAGAKNDSSLKGKIMNYLRKNTAIINSGLFFMSGNSNAGELYRMLMK